MRTNDPHRIRQGTYSIVARDPGSGALGVAVQSHWFSVGPLVPWARPGVGAVATPANIEVSYGPHALDLLERGASAEQALDQLLGADQGADSRQVAIVDGTGGVAAHTGSACIAYAGHVTGEGISAQANIMASERVWPAMLESFSSARGPMAARLLAALDAAGEAGGDIRGRQCAAILVVPATGEPWQTLVSLRVEDHPEPLQELRRLLVLHDAYTLANEGDALSWTVATRKRRRCTAGPAIWPQRTTSCGSGPGSALRRPVTWRPPWRTSAPRSSCSLAGSSGRLPPELAPSARSVRAALGPAVSSQA